MTPPDAEREWWIAELLIRRRWHYVETLLWIAYRDPGVLADWLMHPAKSGENLYRLGAGTVEAIVSLDLEGTDEAVELAPRSALRVALLSGAVKATGLKTEPNGWSGGAITWDRKEIPPEQWEDFVLVDGGGYHRGQIVAYPKDHIWGRYPTSHWADILFERESVTAAFAPLRQKASSRGERLAERELLEAVTKHLQEPNAFHPPVGVKWREEAVDKFGISIRGARRAWDNVAAKYPILSEVRNKPKAKRRG